MASSEIEILFGIPVEPELSTTQAISLSTVSGNGSISGITAFTAGGETNRAIFPAITSSTNSKALAVSLAGTKTNGLGMSN